MTNLHSRIDQIESTPTTISLYQGRNLGAAKLKKEQQKRLPRQISICKPKNSVNVWALGRGR